MKIAFVCMGMTNGGTERVISNLANYFAKEHDVIIIRFIQSVIAYSLDSRVEIRTLDKAIEQESENKIRRSIRRRTALRQTLDREQPDRIVAMLPEPCFLTLSLKGRYDAKIIISERNDPNTLYKNAFYKLMAKYLYKKADGFVAQTNTELRFFGKKVKSRAKIIPNLMTEEMFTTMPLSQDKRRQVITLVGRIDRQKNYMLLIDALNIIRENLEGWQVEIYGRADNVELRDMLVEYILACNLGNVVRYMGPTDNVFDILNNSKIYAICSLYEGSPNTLIEAMSMGCACVSTDFAGGGAREIISNEVNGLIVANNNPQEFAKAIELVISDEQLRERIASNALKIRKEYEINKVRKMWSEFIL